jgi:hypothetical protein
MFPIRWAHVITYATWRLFKSVYSLCLNTPNVYSSYGNAAIWWCYVVLYALRCNPSSSWTHASNRTQMSFCILSMMLKYFFGLRDFLTKNRRVTYIKDQQVYIAKVGDRKYVRTFSLGSQMNGGTRWRSRLRHCTTSWKVRFPKVSLELFIGTFSVCPGL